MKYLFCYIFPFLSVLLWGSCIRAAQGDQGAYTNPILAGDFPDPTIVRIDSDYYMTHSSFNYLPGLVVLHSRDLVNWEPVGCALDRYLGAVWAPDISYYDGKIWIYFTVDSIGFPYTTWMVCAESPEGPWSKPLRLETGGSIDPCHVVDVETGERWLYMSGGRRIALNLEGTETIGKLEKIYDGWTIPEDWTYEGFALEGPKLRRIGDYYYWLNAEGGTAGPPTAHMAVVARSKSLKGPWDNAPENPLVHTYSSDEKWWCKGHSSFIDTPEGDWWLVSHAYRKGFVGLGRQTILEPVFFDEDGWPIAPVGANVDQPIALPIGNRMENEPKNRLAHLSDFRIGMDWRFYKEFEQDRVLNNEKGKLTLKAKGTTPTDASPLLFVAGDDAYEYQVKATLKGDVRVGLVNFYNERFFAGIGYDVHSRFSWRRAEERARRMIEGPSSIWLRLRNQDQILTGYYSEDGIHWEKQTWGYEVSGYNHNTAGEFQSLLPGLVAIGDGEVTFENLKYRKIMPL